MINDKKRNLFFLLGIIIFLLGGCTLAPKYTRPELPVPTQWPKGMTYIYFENAADESTPLASTLSWRDFITDDRLQKVIETALNNNRDLRLAALNVEKARALYGIQRAELLPSVNAVGSMSKALVPADPRERRQAHRFHAAASRVDCQRRPVSPQIAAVIQARSVRGPETRRAADCTTTRRAAAHR